MNWIKNNFGEKADYELPKGASAVILCALTIHGIMPEQLLLPGQVYKDKIEKLKNKYKGNYKGAVIIPIRSNEYFFI